MTTKGDQLTALLRYCLTCNGVRQVYEADDNRDPGLRVLCCVSCSRVLGPAARAKREAQR